MVWVDVNDKLPVLGDIVLVKLKDCDIELYALAEPDCWRFYFLKNIFQDFVIGNLPEIGDIIEVDKWFDINEGE